MFPATALRRPRVSVSATSARKPDTFRPPAPTKSTYSWIDRLFYRASARIARPGGTLFPLSRVIGDDLKFFPNLWLNRALVHEACSGWPSSFYSAVQLISHWYRGLHDWNRSLLSSDSKRGQEDIFQKQTDGLDGWWTSVMKISFTWYKKKCSFFQYQFINKNEPFPLHPFRCNCMFAVPGILHIRDYCAFSFDQSIDLFASQASQAQRHLSTMCPTMICTLLHYYSRLGHPGRLPETLM